MQVRDLMTSPVHTIGPDAPAWEAVGLMRRHRIRRLPVVEGDELVGIVTWTDVVRIRPPALSGPWTIPNLAAAGVQVRHLMASLPFTVTPDAPIDQAAALMRRRKIGGLPVVDNGRLVGIVTESDLFKAFAQIFALGPHEVRLHVPVASVVVLVPQIIAALGTAGVPILSLHTFRVDEDQAVDVVVRDRDESLARESLRNLTLDVELERPLEYSKAR